MFLLIKNSRKQNEEDGEYNGNLVRESKRKRNFCNQPQIQKASVVSNPNTRHTEINEITLKTDDTLKSNPTSTTRKKGFNIPVQTRPETIRRMFFSGEIIFQMKYLHPKINLLIQIFTNSVSKY